jgi:tetratricopeptide (TPR) repeat protein
MILLGVNLEKQGDEDEAIRWYEKAAEAGQPVAMAALGRHLHIRGDVSAAMRWYRSALDADDLSEEVRVDTQIKLGAAHLERGEAGEAIRWFSEASKYGDPRAMTSLGGALLDQGKDDDGLRWLRKAAEAGDANGMAILGFALVERMQKRGTTSDAQEGWVWIRKAATLGNRGASEMVAVSHAARAAMGRNVSSQGARPAQNGGCYIATAVDGSYESPQVMTLRRLRDATLRRTWWGPACIRIYYAVSPRLAVHFGGASVLNRISRRILDRIVARLDA